MKNTNEITIDNRDENSQVVESPNKILTDSIFAKQYLQATKIVSDIIQQISKHNECNKEHIRNKEINNIIAFNGERGAGKSSCMESFSNMLIKLDQVENSSKTIESLKEVNFYALETIDPSMFEDQSNIIEVIVSRMFFNFKEKLERNNTFDYKDMETSLFERFQNVYTALRTLTDQKSDILKRDMLDGLVTISNTTNLKEEIYELIDNYMSYMYKSNTSSSKKRDSFLIIKIDDLDMNICYAYEMVEQIRKYLMNFNIIILMAIKMDQLRNIVKSNFKKDLNYNNDDDTIKEINNMANKYIEKLYPISHQIHLHYSDLTNCKVKILKDNSDKFDIFETSNDAITSLFYTRFGIKLWKDIDKHLAFAPKNLRESRQLMRFLSLLPQVEKTEHEKIVELKKNFNLDTSISNNTYIVTIILEHLRILADYYPNHIVIKDILDIESASLVVERKEIVSLLNEYVASSLINRIKFYIKSAESSNDETAMILIKKITSEKLDHIKNTIPKYECDKNIYRDNLSSLKTFLSNSWIVTNLSLDEFNQINVLINSHHQEFYKLTIKSLNELYLDNNSKVISNPEYDYSNVFNQQNNPSNVTLSDVYEAMLEVESSNYPSIVSPYLNIVKLLIELRYKEYTLADKRFDSFFNFSNGKIIDCMFHKIRKANRVSGDRRDLVEIKLSDYSNRLDKLDALEKNFEIVQFMESTVYPNKTVKRINTEHIYNDTLEPGIQILSPFGHYNFCKWTSNSSLIDRSKFDVISNYYNDLKTKFFAPINSITVFYNFLAHITRESSKLINNASDFYEELIRISDEYFQKSGIKNSYLPLTPFIVMYDRYNIIPRSSMSSDYNNTKEINAFFTSLTTFEYSYHEVTSISNLRVLTTLLEDKYEAINNSKYFDKFDLLTINAIKELIIDINKALLIPNRYLSLAKDIITATLKSFYANFVHSDKYLVHTKNFYFNKLTSNTFNISLELEEYSNEKWCIDTRKLFKTPIVKLIDTFSSNGFIDIEYINSSGKTIYSDELKKNSLLGFDLNKDIISSYMILHIDHARINNSYRTWKKTGLDLSLKYFIEVKKIKDNKVEVYCRVE